MRTRRAVVIFLVAALATAACSSGTKIAASTTTALPTTTVVTVAPTTTVAADPAATAKAAAAILQPVDFPTGWKALTAPDDGGLNLETVWQEITKCVGLVSPPPTGVATSPTFLRGLATQVRSTVEYTTAAAAAADAAALAAPKFQGCANDAFAADAKRNAPEGGVPGPVAIAPLAAPSLAATKSVTYRVNVTINFTDLQVPLFQDFLVMFKGTAVIRMLFLNPGSEFPQDLERTLVDKVVSRS